MRRAIIPLLTAAVVLGGCGGSSKSDEQAAVRSAVTSYFHAFAGGDSQQVCARIAKDSLAKLQKASHLSCAQAVSQATKRPEVKKYLAQIGNVKVKSVSVTGNTATSVVQAIGTTTTVPLKKEGGQWKITSALGS